MTHAPLRRIISVEIEVLREHRGKPLMFIVRKQLDCGHQHACLGWDYLDLMNPYTTNPEVTARRHRCRQCARAATLQPLPREVGQDEASQVQAA